MRVFLHLPPRGPRSTSGEPICCLRYRRSLLDQSLPPRLHLTDLLRLNLLRLFTATFTQAAVLSIRLLKAHQPSDHLVESIEIPRPTAPQSPLVDVLIVRPLRTSSTLVSYLQSEFLNRNRDACACCRDCSIVKTVSTVDSRAPPRISPRNKLSQSRTA